MVVRSDDTSGVQEADNNETAETPARETDQEALEVLDQALVGREVSVRLVCNRVDAGNALELFTQVFSIVLDNIVVPEDVKTAAMATPADQEDSAPEGHED